MTTPAFTPTQRAAINAEASAMVRAGAGSGKTAVLTARYMRALAEGTRPGQIVAMTFTEKAAAEMRERIRGEIAALDGDRAAIARTQEELVEAHVGTIHAFCTAILRQFPIEAGVDPDFEVADDSVAQQLRRRAADAAIDAAAASDTHPLHASLDLLLSFYTRRQVADMALAVYEKQRHFPDATHGLLNRSADELPAIWQAWLDAAVCAAMRSLAQNVAVRHICAALMRLLDACSNPDDKMLGTAHAVAHALASADETGIDRLRAAASALAASLFDKDGRPRSFTRLGNKKHWPAGTLEKARALLTEMLDHAESFASLSTVVLGEPDRLIARVVHALWRLVGEMGVQYELLKGNGRTLDFDDLESRTIELLGSDRGRAVVGTLRERYRLILVDESQDLNVRQFRLIELLAGGPTPTAKPALFAVGDPQQAIFGFRNADVRFLNAIRHELIPQAHEPRALDENFRSTPALAAFANRVFARILTGAESFEVAYTPMRATRAPSFASALELRLARPAAANANSGAKRAAQATAVATRIERICREGAAIISDPVCPGIERAASFGDIAILLRTRRILPLLLDELRARAVPCSVYKGIGSYQSQEVRDVFTCLRFLADGSRDLDLAGWLRSPFFGLSDDGLFLLAHDRGQRPLYDVLRHPPPTELLSSADRVVVARAQRLVPGWCAAVDLVPPSRVLARILDETGAWGVYAAMGADGSLGKLLRILREIEQHAGSLSQIVDVLEERIRTVHREGDELAEAIEDDAVKIMTVHAAKGLQFPIVFVLGLDDNLVSGHRAASLRIDPDLGFAVDTPPALAKAAGWSSGAAVSFIGDRIRRKELAEARRLLYVACTRARDHLFLVGSDDRPPEQSWQQWLVEALELGGFLEQEHDALELTLDRSVLRVVRQEPHAVSAAPARRPTTGRPAPRQQATASVEDLARLIAPIEAQSHLPTVTVSQLVDHARCPRLYYARHVLGLEIGARAIRDDENNPDERPTEDVDQSALGRVVHALLERTPPSETEDLDEFARRAACQESLDAAQTDQLAERAATVVRHFLDTDLGRSVLGGESFRELPFAVGLDTAVLLGRIDRLIVGTPPRVVDFKLPRDPARVTAPALEREYGLQLQAYALAASRLLGAEAVRTSIVLPELGRSFEWNYDAGDIAAIAATLAELAAAVARIDIEAPSFTTSACGVCAACRMMPDLAFTRA